MMTSGAFKDATNGRQRTTDGIRKHTGPFYLVGDLLQSGGTLTPSGIVLPPGSVGLSQLSPLLSTFEVTLGSDFALGTATFTTVLYAPLLAAGAVWRIFWKASLQGVAASGSILAAALFSQAGAILDLAEQITYGNNYGGAAPDFTLNGMAVYTPLAAEQPRIMAYCSHAGAIAKVRGAAFGSGSGTWLRGERIG